MITNFIRLSLTCVLFTASAAAQVQKPCGATDVKCKTLDSIIQKVRIVLEMKPDSPNAFSSAVGQSNITDVFDYQQAAVAAKNAVQASTTNSTALQPGSTSASSGSTSLAQKGAVSQILSAAVENGGLTKDTSGTTVTFRGNPIGLIEAPLKQYDLYAVLSDIEHSSAKKFLNRFSFALSFDTSRGGVQNTLLANSQQLSSWSGRVELVNQRDAKLRRYAMLWQAVAVKNAPAVQKGEVDYLNVCLEKWPAFEEWDKQTEQLAAKFDSRLRADQSLATPAKLEPELQSFRDELKAQMEKLGDLPNAPHDCAKDISTLVTTLKVLSADSNKVLSLVQQGQLLTFDWTTKRDPNLPDLYANTVVYQASKAWKNRTDDFTFNANLNWYRVNPMASVGKLKDFNAVAEYDIPLGKIQSFGSLQLNLTGKYQYVAKSVTSITAATGAASGSAGPPVIGNIIPTIQGSLGAFQVKLSIPGGSSGVRIPLAFTASTRSEIFNKPDYKASVGLSFNLDALFAKQ